MTQDTDKHSDFQTTREPGADTDSPGGKYTYGDLIERIRSNRMRLRPAERRVAEVVLDDIEAAIRTPNSKLASAARVSEPTVTRFCRAMGCEGVRDFKLRLAQSLVAKTMAPPESESQHSSDLLPYWNAVFAPGH